MWSLCDSVFEDWFVNPDRVDGFLQLNRECVKYASLEIFKELLARDGITNMWHLYNVYKHEWAGKKIIKRHFLYGLDRKKKRIFKTASSNMLSSTWELFL